MQVESSNTTNNYNQNTTSKKNEEKSGSFLEQLEANKEEESSVEKLIEDIRSVLKTGLTVSELEHLRELIAELIKKIKEDDGTDPKRRNDLERSVAQIEFAIISIKKKISGESIIEAEKNPEKPNEKPTSLKNDSGALSSWKENLLDKLDKVEEEIKKLEVGAYKFKNITNNDIKFRLLEEQDKINS